MNAETSKTQHSGNRPQTYEATINGRKVRVTIPDDPDPQEMLVDAIMTCFSPPAVAVLANAVRVQANGMSRRDVRGELKWFADLLVGMVGKDEYPRLCQEAGL